MTLTGSLQSFTSASSNATNLPRDGSNNCYHKIPAKLRTVRVGSNAGKKFFGCSLWHNGDCGYFAWLDVVYESNANAELEDLHVKLMEKERTISQLLMERKKFEEKILKLKLKREKDDEAMTNLRQQLAMLHLESAKYGREENFLAIVLVMSWILFGIVIFFFKHLVKGSVKVC